MRDADRRTNHFFLFVQVRNRPRDIIQEQLRCNVISLRVFLGTYFELAQTKKSVSA